MNKNILIVLGGGFLVALLVAIIVQASFGSKPKEGMVQVAVAAKPLKAGDPVSDSNFKWQDWPEDNLVAGSVVREDGKKISEQAKGKLRRDVSSGEPLMESSITSGKGNILAASMERGMRAMAIKVSAESMVGGFISPGDRVDVILTYQVKVSGATKDEVADTVSRHATQTVLENVKVLAIDQSATKDDSSKAKVGRTVTLEVDMKAAERLALVSEMGDLSLVLRALGDDQVADPRERNFTTDVEVSDVLQEIGKIKKSSGGSSNIVRVYSGQNIENVNVRH